MFRGGSEGFRFALLCCAVVVVAGRAKRLWFGKAAGAKRVAMFLNQGPRRTISDVTWSKEKGETAQGEQMENRK
jgi:hypothetical protein